VTKHKSVAKSEPRKSLSGSQYRGLRGKIVDWAEHVFEEGMLYLRVRFKDQTELCWVLQTAHVILEADLSDWKTGDSKQLTVYAQNESDWK
jgi:hypothetical protein